MFFFNPLQFDFSFFNTTTVPLTKVFDQKFPAIEPNYEAIDVADLFIGEWLGIEWETVGLFPVIISQLTSTIDNKAT